MSQQQTGARRVQAVDHAVQILDCFLDGQKSLGLREIAGELNLNKSSVYRLLETLVIGGLLAKDPFSRGYTLGIKLVQLAQRLGTRFALTETAMPLLQRLRDETGETSALHVRIGAQRLCVAQLASSQPVRMMLEMDRPYPLVHGAAGKVFLAYLPSASIHALLAELSPEAGEALVHELPTIRQEGYAVSRGEVIADTTSICAAVLSRTGEPAAALGIHGPAYRIPKAAIPGLAKQVLDVAADLGRLLPP